MSASRLAAFSVREGRMDLEVMIESRFGRAPYFLLVDMESDSPVKLITNDKAMGMGHGAGIKTASLIIEEGCNMVVSGLVGPKAFSVLSSAGITVFSGIEGSVREAIQAIKDGRVAPDNAPSSHGHGFMAGERERKRFRMGRRGS